MNADEVKDLSTEELEAILAKRKKSERAAQEKKVQQYQDDKLEFISEQFAEAEKLAESLKKLKQNAIVKGGELHAQMYELFNRKEQDLKEFSIFDKEGREATMKLTIQSMDIMRMNETAEVHANAMRDIIKEKFYKKDQDGFGFLNDLLSKNADGTWDAKVLVTAKKWEKKVNDPRYSTHLQGLIEAMFVDGTALYVRYYRKNATTKKWDPINIQFSSL